MIKVALVDKKIVKHRSNRVSKPKTIDEYLAAVGDDKRAVLEKLRKGIRAAAPKAEECISCGVPAFRLNGKFLVAFGVAANHCAFYPGSTVQGYKDELKEYDVSKGTIRFNQVIRCRRPWCGRS